MVLAFTLLRRDRLTARASLRAAIAFEIVAGKRRSTFDICMAIVRNRRYVIRPTSRLSARLDVGLFGRCSKSDEFGSYR